MKTTVDQTIRKFSEVLRRFEREVFVLNNESCCSGVTLAQCHTLLEIECKDKESITDLAKALCLDKSTVSRTIDGLVNIGLVNRTIPAENRRMATLELTEAGKNICNTINGSNDKYIDETLSILTDSEKEEFTRLFDKITNRMTELRSSCATL